MVLDNLNTHTIGALYEAFEPARARHLARRIEFHCEPEHGSWLNIAANELSAMTRQCLSARRTGDIGHVVGGDRRVVDRRQHAPAGGGLADEERRCAS